MSNKIRRIIPYLLIIVMSIFGLRYQPNGLSWTELLRPYDFFACSPSLPWFLTIFVALVAYLLLRQRFFDATTITAMVLILIFIVNYPHLVYHNVFAHNTATIEMLRCGTIESISIAEAKLWPGFFFTAGSLMLITGLDIVALNDLMLSLFVLLIATISYCFAKRAYKITNNRIVMYAPLFMLIFLFNNRVLYEFMFDHQWYTITLFTALIYTLLQLELRKKPSRGPAIFVSLLVVSTAITITHPITGFMSCLIILLYAVGRRSALTAALTSACIYVSWWTFVSYTYIGEAWHWVEILLQGGMVSEFVTRSFHVEEVLPLYGVVARYVYKAYFGAANLVSLLTLFAILFKKIDGKRVAGIALVSTCAWLGVVVFAPVGITSVLWNDRIFWHISFPLAITSTIGLILYSNYFRKSKVLMLLRKKLDVIMLPVILLGLISSSFLLFEINYYPLYYSPSSDIELSKWAVMHSGNGTRFAVGHTLRLVEYYVAIYKKDIEAPAEYVTLKMYANSIDDLLNPLRVADITLYTCHLEYSLRMGMYHLGYSVHNETVKHAINSVLGMHNVIYNDGRNRAFGVIG